MAVVPYFLFAGLLVERIRAQSAAWAETNSDVHVVHGPHLGADVRIARLVLERYHEATGGDVRMNCDLCVYRVSLPGYEHRVGTPGAAHVHSAAGGG